MFARVLRACAHTCYTHAVPALAAALTLLSLTATAATPARPADAFVDSIGVNIHAWIPNTSYLQNWQGAIDALKYTGIRYVRDTPWEVDRLNQLTDQTGAKVVAIIHSYSPFGNLNPAALPGVMEQAASLRGLAYLEGPNEYEWLHQLDPQPDPDWAGTLRNWVTQMHSIAKSNPVLADKPIVAPSLWEPKPHLAPVAHLIDIGNFHGYPPLTHIHQYLGFYEDAARSVTGPDKPVFFTEVGFNTAVNASLYYRGVSEAAQAKFTTRAFAETFLLGIDKHFVYELLDASDNPARDHHDANWGLFRADFTYKPAAHAVKNLIQLLEDPARPFVPGELDYTISQKDYFRHFILQKQNGDYYMVLWFDLLSYDRENKQDIHLPPQPITINFEQPILSGATYLPNGSPDPTQTFGPVSQLNLMVGDELMLVKLRPHLIPGDATFDRIVDAADFMTLFNNFGHPGDVAHGDFNADHLVNFADFQILEREFGRPLPPELLALATNVPEPTTPALAALALALLYARRPLPNQR